MSEPLVSIIIPIYNVEQYLQHCLDTVKNQSYKNIEVIMVNDGSPDQSAVIAKKFVSEDGRFRYYEKENGGLSSARNYGIERCIGEYISFIDSDDWVEREFIEKLVSVLQESCADIAVCNMKYVYKDGTERSNVPKIREEKTVSNMEALSDLFNSRYFRNHAQNKVYKASLFKDTGIRYPIGKLYEDVFTTYKLFYEAESVVYVPMDLYDYLQARPGSILNSGFSKKQLDIFEGMDCIKDFLIDKKIYDELKDDYVQLVISNILAIGNFIYPAYHAMTDAQKREIKQIIKTTKTRFNLEEYSRKKSISEKQKGRYFMMLHMLGVYCLIMKVLRK